MRKKLKDIAEDVDNEFVELLSPDNHNQKTSLGKVLDIQKALTAQVEEAYDLGDVNEPELQNMLKKSFEEMTEKNNLPIKYKDFDEIIQHIADYNANDSDAMKLYVSQMINAITDQIKMKSVITLGYLHDKALTEMMKRAADPTRESLELCVSGIREIHNWMDKAEDLRNKFYIKGSQKQLNNLANATNKDNSNKLSQAALNQIVAKINAYSNDKKSETK